MTPTSAEIFGRSALLDVPLTEAGASERFAALHGDNLKFDHRRGRWLFWSGHRWTPDTDGAVMRLALEFVRAWQADAVEIADRGRKEDVFRFLLRLERRDALTSLLSLAGSMRPIATSGESWDSDPWLLCAPNGVVDLRTGILQPGQRSDLITLATAATFDPDAACPRWARFISEIFGGDSELVAFVRRAIGYSLTGITTEQCLMLAYGVGANGKSTLVNAIASTLGDYAHNLPFSSLEYSRASSIPNDIASLVGRRFVSSSEANDGTRLNESRVKALTGCDPMPARFLHQEWFSFAPVCKIWLAVNHKPIVRDDSFGFWRRVRLVPFAQTFSVDARLADALRAEAPGILRWAVEGCLAWQRDGLSPPDVVTRATSEYEQDSDHFGQFVDEALTADPEAHVRAADLYQHYRLWADRHGLTERERLTATGFGRKAAERFPRRATETGKVYEGVRRI